MEILFQSITWTKILATTLIIITGLMIYQFIWKYWTYFSNRNIPFIRGVPFLGSNYKLFMGEGNLNDCYEYLYKKFPNEPLIGIYDFGGVPVYLVRDPELIKQITIGKSMTENSAKNIIKLLGFASCPKLMNLFKIRLISKKVEQYFRNVIHNTIDYRQKNNIQRLDMVDLLMKTNQDFTETDIVAQCMIFFVAGFDTVSTLLSFMAHELAINQQIQNKLYEEIVNSAEKLNNQQISYEIINNMKYLDMCISETLRKWTTAGLIDRVTSRKCQLEYDNGKILKLNIGDSFIIPSFAIHRDSKYYSNPNVFDPERFSDENVKNILPGTYMPFGIGPRICIGSRFALMETKAIFYYLLLNFHIEKCDKTQDPLKLGMTGTPDNGFWLQLKKRIN